MFFHLEFNGRNTLEQGQQKTRKKTNQQTKKPPENYEK